MGEVVEFKPKAEVIQLHGDREDETDGLAPQERTVIPLARGEFEYAQRKALPHGLLDIDMDDGKYQAVRLGEPYEGDTSTEE